MVASALKLVDPSESLQEAFYRYCDAFREMGEKPRPLEELAYQDFLAFIQKLRDQTQGIGIPPDHVPSTTFWLVRDDQTIVGNSNLRHRLTPNLEDLGGHIGYAIHPLERRKGYGSLLLKLTLEKARQKGLRRVLVTCAVENVASAGVIKNNGGVLATQGMSTQGGFLVSRYWIDL